MRPTSACTWRHPPRGSRPYAPSDRIALDQESPIAEFDMQRLLAPFSMIAASGRYPQGHSGRIGAEDF